MLANTSGFVYYVSITGITGAAAPDAGKVARGGRAHQAAHDAAGRGRLRRADARSRRAAIARGADGVVVGSALVDAVRGSLDEDGKATAAHRRRRSTDLVAELAARRAPAAAKAAE